MSAERGKIYNESAYAQGKMLDHSSWNGLLPRNITPSDIDMAIDNNGNILYCELSSRFSTWIDPSSGSPSVGFGQFKLYKSAIESSQKHLAVLCRHNVPNDRSIDSLTDIENYQVMCVSNGQAMFTPVWPGWNRFVLAWFKNPEDVRKIVKERAGGEN